MKIDDTLHNLIILNITIAKNHLLDETAIDK